MSSDIEFHTEFESFSSPLSDYPNHSHPTELLGTSDNTLKEQEWIQAAKVGQIVQIEGKPYVLTREAIISSLGTWKDGFIKDDHKAILAGFKVYGDKFEDPFLSLLLDQPTIQHLKASVGGSIDAKAMVLQEEKVTKMAGAGYSILSKGLVPSCPPAAGCGDIAAAASKAAIDMAEEKKDESFSGNQVKELIAAAISKETDILNNAHDVKMNDLKTEQTDAITLLEETQKTDMDTQKTQMFELAALIETAKTKYGLDEEKVKLLKEAKTPEDILKCFSELEVKKDTEVAASAGDGKEGDTGVVVGSASHKEAVTRIEEVGSFDPYTKEWVPSYREEVE